MTQVYRKLELKAPAHRVWDTIGGFHSLPDWHPAVASGEIELGGLQRSLRLDNGAVAIERLLFHDDAAMTQRYNIVNSPLPVSDYLATLRVEPVDEGKCVVHWTGEFEPAGVPEHDAATVIAGIYEAGLEALAERFTGPRS